MTTGKELRRWSWSQFRLWGFLSSLDSKDQGSEQMHMTWFASPLKTMLMVPVIWKVDKDLFTVSPWRVYFGVVPHCSKLPWWNLASPQLFKDKHMLIGKASIKYLLIWQVWCFHNGTWLQNRGYWESIALVELEVGIQVRNEVMGYGERAESWERMEVLWVCQRRCRMSWLEVEVCSVLKKI